MFALMMLNVMSAQSTEFFHIASWTGRAHLISTTATAPAPDSGAKCQPSLLVMYPTLPSVRHHASSAQQCVLPCALCSPAHRYLVVTHEELDELSEAPNLAGQPWQLVVV